MIIIRQDGLRATRETLERIEQYREVFAAAVRQRVRRTGLTDDIDANETILIERMNAKRRKAGFNTDWNGELFTA
jgi:hypothetical protein